MGVLSFTSSGSGLAANNANVASLSTAVGIKMRMKVDFIKTGSGFNSSGLIRSDSDGAGTNTKFELECDCNNSSQFRFVFRITGVHTLTGAYAAQSGLPVTGTFLVLYAGYASGPSGSTTINLTDDAGTNYFAASDAPNTAVMSTTGNNGRVNVNKDTSDSTQAETYDGVAIYNQLLVGSAQYSPPEPGDAGIVAAWVFDDVGTPSTAQAFVGGQGLVLTASQYTWQSGGIWTPVVNKPPTQPKIASFAAINRSFSW